MKSTLLIAHLRDILILPFTVTVIVPYLIFDASQHIIEQNISVMITGFVFATGGLSLFLYTLMLMNNVGKGTLAPWTVKQQLIIIGPYRYCRNPMITGVLFILIGEGLVVHSTNILIWATIFFLTNTMYFIVSEEPRLEEIFGEQYREYKRHVPRWIPRLTPYHP